MATPTAPAVITAVLGGHLDGELGHIHTAIKQRVADSGARFCWRVEFDGLDITEENQTMNEVDAVERATKKTWGQFSPFVSAGECSAIIVAALHHRTKMPYADALELVGQRGALDILKCVSEYELGNAPKDAPSDTP